MSNPLLTAAFATDLDPSDRFVLVALANRANKQGRCWPSVAQLAKDTGLARATIFRALNTIEAAGHIDRDVRPGKGTVYVVHPRQSGTEHRAPVAQCDPSQGETSRMVRPVAERDLPVSPCDPNPSHSETQTVSKPKRTSTRAGARGAIQGVPRSSDYEQLKQIEDEIRSNRAGCVEMGYASLIGRIRDRCTHSVNLKSFCDRLSAELDRTEASA